MSDIVIKAETLGKRYTIGHHAEHSRDTTFREVMAQNARNVWNKTRDLFSGRPIIQGETLEEVWALRDVSFEIRRGEAVGIIGRNGAGKSTLLKILSRITEPTEGRVTIRGRVASLLEVGTGFHAELSGRENIYLNGAILGMTRAEIKRKFDEIVAFAEVEKYLDTPVKRYSSGMYVRLAFAVAAHLEPEILVVDEVLAVGDALFQTKCLARMKNMMEQNRTVLFVSHNMAAVGSICSRGIVLDTGEMFIDSTIQKAINFYEKEIFQNRYLSKPIIDRTDRKGTKDIILTSFHIEDQDGRQIDSASNGHTIRLVFGYQTRDNKEVKNVNMGILVEKGNGDRVFQFGTRFTGQQIPYLRNQGTLTCIIQRFPLAPGRYRIGSYLECESAPSDYMDTLTYLDVIDGDFYGSKYQIYENETQILIDGTWQYE